MKLNYESGTSCSTGYEDVLGILKKYSREQYLQMNEQERQVVVDEIFSVYRDKNIFPIQYYNESGIIDEIRKCVEKDVELTSDTLDFKFNQGSSLCKFLFPNIFEVEFAGDKRIMSKKFYDDHILKRCIDFSLRFKKTATPSEIRTSMELIGGGVATNFPPMKAKALYEKYVPVNGIIYDFACGFGGRMLGALSSKNNYKYFGVEPNSETFESLSVLGSYIEQATDRDKIFKVYKQGSEDFMIKENYADFAFSSPPYFSLEKYSDEETQCYNKFPELESWFDGYVRPTIENIYKMLKPNCYYAVNIADFNIGSKRVEYVDRWIEMSKEVGFEFVEHIFMKLQTRKGVGHGDETGKSKEKQEGIFVFIKK